APRPASQGSRRRRRAGAPRPGVPGDRDPGPATGGDQAMTTRREFLGTAATAAAASALHVPLVHAGGDDVLKIGLIGCGGRGTGAAEQALNADKNVKLVAMGDAFSDRLASSLKILSKSHPEKVEVKEENCFTGFDAYKGVIAASDVV